MRIGVLHIGPKAADAKGIRRLSERAGRELDEVARALRPAISA
jgi:hypothetical protein